MDNKKLVSILTGLCSGLFAAATFTACGITKPHEHSYMSQTTDPTCTKEGSVVYTCDCGETYSEAIPALGHVEKTCEGQAPTCGAAGWAEYVCCEREGCDYSTYEEVAATGLHTWDEGVTTVEPTPMGFGEKVYTCSVCDAERKEELDILGVEWTDALTVKKVAAGDGYAVSLAAGFDDDTVKEISIPASYTSEDGETLPVVAIEAEAFANCRSLEVLNIPDTIRTIYIGEGGHNATGSAFFGCENLKAVNVYKKKGTHETYFKSVDGVLLRYAQPNVPMEHGTELYYFPVAKTGEYVVPDEVQYIPQKTFQKAKITKVTIPANVALIGRQAFERSSLVSVVFADGAAASVEDLAIGASAFAYCYSLTTVDFPARLGQTAFGEDKIFDNCTALTDINIVGKNGEYTSKDGMLCDASGRLIIYCPVGKAGKLAIPASVQGIAAGAFKNCSKLTGLEIGANVVEIGEEAFMGCRSVTTVEFVGTAGNLSIKEKAFYGCTMLRELELSQNVTKIAEMAFGNTPLNTRVKLNAGANIEYADGAFMDEDGKGYVTDVVIGEKMGTFEIRGMFAGCNIKNVTVEGNNKNYSTDENGVLYDAEKTKLLFYPKKQIAGYTIPATVTTISAGVFEGNNDFESFVIGKNVTTIGANAFKNMVNLKSVTFEEGRTASLTIGESAFEGCEFLATIELPETLTEIGAHAFENCIAITTLTLPSTLTKMGNDKAGVFDGCTNLATITVATGNEAFEDINGIVYAKTDGDATALLFVPTSYEGAVVIPKTVHTIPEKAFYGHAGVTSIMFEDNQAPVNIRIGEEAFAKMTAVAKVVLPTNLTIIPTGLLQESSVQEVFVPNTVNTIQLRAFLKASQLTTLTFEDGNYDNTLVIEDGNWAASGHAASQGIINGAPLTNGGLVLPERVKRIPNYCFNAASFVSVTIPASIEYIGNNAFSSATMTSITFAEGTAERPRAGFTLGYNAFSSCKNVSTLHIPNSIKKFEGIYPYNKTLGTGSYCVHGAFSSMSGLQTVTFEEGVQRIGTGMFYGSGTTTATVVLPNSLVIIEDAAFATAKFASVTFGEKLATISRDAFYNMANLTTVDFSANKKLSSIGDFAFGKCTKLTAVTLADNSANGVTELAFGKTVFNGCTGLTTATVPATVKTLNNAFVGCTKVVVTHVGNEATADENGFQLTADGKRLVKFTNTTATEVVVPAGVEVIGDSAFLSNTKITKVTLPATVKSVEGYAFNGCTNLATIEGCASLEKVGHYAFSGTKIVSVDLSNVTSMGDYVFYNCKSLTDVTLNNNLYVIGASAFENCTALVEIDLPAQLTTLGFKAFSGCSKLASIVLPENLTHSDISTSSGSWFYMCTSLASVTINSKALGVLPNNAFYYCTALESIVIPEGVTTIVGSFDMGYGSAKLKNITFPSTLTAIYGSNILGAAFAGTSIEEIDLSHTQFSTYDTIYLNSTEKHIFANMGSLKTIKLPETFTTFSPQFFDGCSNLETVIAPGVTVVPTVSSYSPMKNKTKLTTVQLSDELVSIGNYAFYNCTSLAEFNFPDTLVSIGEEAFVNTKLSNLAFGNHLETIGAGAFYNTLVEEVTIPGSVTEIGAYAFAYCANFVRFEVSNSNPRYHTGAFGELYDNTNMLVAFPAAASGVEGVVDMSAVAAVTFGAGAFSSCFNIQKVILPADMYEIPESMFEDSSITEIVIPDTVAKIGVGAFAGCDGLTKVTLPASVKELCAGAFYNCANLAEIVIPEGVSIIGSQAFAGCVSLTEIVLPASVSSIVADAFSGCTNLTKFVVDSNNAYYYAGTYGELYAVNGQMICFPAKNTVADGKVTLKAGVKLYDGAFSGRTDITEVVLPSDLTAIPADLFTGSGVTKVVVPKTVTSIVASALKPLEEIVFEEGRTASLSLASKFFQKNNNLKKLELNGNITLGTYAFEQCKSLETLKISGQVTLGNYSFQNCTALTSVTVSGVKSFGTYMFNGCSALETATVDFAGTLGNYAFQNCTSLTTVTLKNVTSTGTYTFKGCSALTTVTLPSTLTKIDSYAFQNCTKVTNLIIPAKVTTISTNAFSGCTKAQTVYAEATSKPSGWNATTIALVNVVYYSETELAGAWHYVEGVPTLW